jgi:thioredoxin-like negative regulator of GroEL
MLASVYGRTGDFAKMRDLLVPLVKATPDNQDAALQLAAALLNLGDIPSARALVGRFWPGPVTTIRGTAPRELLGQIAKLQKQP